MSAPIDVCVVANNRDSGVKNFVLGVVGPVRDRQEVSHIGRDRGFTREHRCDIFIRHRTDGDQESPDFGDGVVTDVVGANAQGLDCLFIAAGIHGEALWTDGKLDAVALADTNRLELRVFGSDAHGHAVLVARLDNLGKGASGAAVQNLRLMLGL